MAQPVIMVQADGITPFSSTVPFSTSAAPYGVGQTAVIASSANVANAAATATMPAVAAKTNYMTGFQITAAGATAGVVVAATVTGVVGGPLNYIFPAPAGALVGATPLAMTFNPPLPASAVNTAIVVTLPALGAGNTNAAAVVTGWVG